MAHKNETKRQLFHLIFGLVLFFLYYFNFLNSIHFFILFLISLMGSAIYLYYQPKIIKWFIEKFDRDSKIPAEGVFFLFLGFAVSTFFFEKQIAIIGLLTLIIGDSISPLIGINFGKIKNPLNKKRNIEGLITGYLATLVFISWLTNLTFLISIIVLVGMVIESLELKRYSYAFDDNTFIPLITCLLLVILNGFPPSWPLNLLY